MTCLARIPTLILLMVTQVYFAAARAEEAADPNAAILARLENIEQLLTNQGLLEILQQMEALQEEINRLRGEIEVQDHVLEQMKKRQRDLYTDVDRRMQRLEGPPPVTDQTAAIEPATGGASPPLETLSPIIDPVETGENLQADTPLTLELVGQDPTATVTETAVMMDTGVATASLMADTDQDTAAVTGTPDQGMPPAMTTPGEDTTRAMTAAGHDTTALIAPESVEDDIAGTPVEADPDQIRADYQRAFRLLKQSLYDQSIKAFREFLALYPDSEYADNAQFWLGETYYVNRLFDRALVEYTNLLQNYPDSQKLAQAKLKTGFCQHELGQLEQARKQLEELIQQHPGTTSARLAEDRLKELAAITIPTDMVPAD